MTLELIDGSLFLQYETGGGLTSRKEALVGNHLNNGQQHKVNLQLSDSGSVIIIDDNNCSNSNVTCFFETKTTDNEVPLFTPEMFIGGIPSTDNASVFHLQTDSSLVSTISNLQINYTNLKFADVNFNDVVSGTVHTESLCSNLHCNNGVCEDLWVASTCRCDSFYTGELCDILTTAHLSGQSSLYFDGIAINDTLKFEVSFPLNHSSGLIVAISEVWCLCTIYGSTITFIQFVLGKQNQPNKCRT